MVVLHPIQLVKMGLNGRPVLCLGPLVETALPFAIWTVRNGRRMEALRAQFWAGYDFP